MKRMITGMTLAAALLLLAVPAAFAGSPTCSDKVSCRGTGDPA